MQDYKKHLITLLFAAEVVLNSYLSAIDRKTPSPATASDNVISSVNYYDDILSPAGLNRLLAGINEEEEEYASLQPATNDCTDLLEILQRTDVHTQLPLSTEDELLFIEEELQLVEEVGRSPVEVTSPDNSAVIDAPSDESKTLSCSWRNGRRVLCKASFSTEKELDYHYRQHIKMYCSRYKNSAIFYCQWKGCKSFFSNRTGKGLFSFCRHLYSSHTHYRTYNCSYPMCSKTFTDRSHLRAHVLEVHHGKKRVRSKAKKVPAKH